MKKLIPTILIAILLPNFSFSQDKGWTPIQSQNPSQKELTLVSSTIGHTVLKFSIAGFHLDEVETSKGKQTVVTIDNGSPLLIEGSPDVPKATAPIIIPDRMQMESAVISSKYQEYTGIEMAPSKGSFSRKINPSSVAYTYGTSYSKDEFFPGKLADLNDPYILRDYRGQTVNFYPVQYNPVTKTLRIYYEILVEVQNTNLSGINEFIRDRSEPVGADPEFHQLYSKRFLNYASLNTSSNNFAPTYDPVKEEGSMLILCPKTFLTTMQPFVQWKKLKGIRTEIVDASLAGTTSTAIQTYISNYYKNNKSLKYVLLVGDDAEIPPSTSGSDPSDNKYGCLAGNDSYVEVFVGRFSGSTVADITTQATRTIKYEKETKVSETYLNKAAAVASGDEKDDVNCIDGIIGQMKGSTYGTVTKITSGAGTQLVDKINAGLGFVPHSGHGLKTSLGSISFSTSSCSKLTNTTSWPYMFCLACDVGIFTKGTCLAEAMVRASYNNLPSGFVATQMAAISQPWYEPYSALKEQVAIMTDQYQTNSKWTFGGIAMNGCAKMLDDFPKTGANVSDTWIIFGDPSLLVFTTNPSAMTVKHANSIALATTTFDVSCDMKDALISLTAGGEIIGTAYSNGGITPVQINPGLSTTLSTIQVTITAKNRVPYTGNVNVVPTVSVNELDQNEQISMYPNPVAKILHIQLGNIDTKNLTLSVYDVSGKMVLNIQPSVVINSVEADLSTLTDGLYYVNLKTDFTSITRKMTLLK